ncbi:MAG: hypothetical protein ABIH26_12490 [Candidatus Eisenbacteria bacterium]
MARRGGGRRAPVERPPSRAGRGALLAVAVIGGILLAFYWRNLVGFPGERTFFWEDFLEQNYPYRAFEAEELRAGRLPFWNPYQFCGMPFVADIQAATFYPLNAGLALFVRDGRLAPVWVEAVSVLHALLGGFFLYLLVRYRTRCSYASILAGTSWALSGFFVVRMIHLNVLSVVAWTPLLLLLLLAAIERRSLAAAALGGVVLGISLLGGSPQFSLYVLLALGLLALYEALRPAGAAGSAAARLAPFGLLGLVVVIGFGVAAIQILPTEELSGLSTRAEMTYEKSTECSFGPASFATLLVPHVYGRYSGGAGGGYWGPGRYFYLWELTAYTGVVVLLLAAVAIAYRPRERSTLFFIVLGIFGLILGLGRHGPLHPLFYKVLPVYDRFRCPGRALFLTGLALSFLAGRGALLIGERAVAPCARKWILAAAAGFFLAAGTIGYLVGRPEGGAGGSAVPPEAAATALRSYVLFLLFLVPAAVLLIAWAFGKGGLSRGARGSLLALAAAELFVLGFGFNDGGVDPDRYYRGDSATVDLLREEARGGLYRVKTRADEGMVLPRNMGSVNRIPSADGYNQLKLQRYEDLQVEGGLPLGRFLDLLGIRVFATFDRESRELRLARNEDPLPKAWFAGEAEIDPDASSRLARLGSESFDPQGTVLLEQSGGEPAGGEGSAVVTRWGPNRIEVEAETSGPGYLVLGEIAYPAWRVRVDGEERDPLVADHALRAVRLDEGRHTVVWEYRSRSFRRGAFITLLALALAALIVFGVTPRRGDRLAAVWKGLLEGRAE